MLPIGLSPIKTPCALGVGSVGHRGVVSELSNNPCVAESGPKLNWQEVKKDASLLEGPQGPIRYVPV